MEILAYSHLATAEESSTVESTFASVNWKRFSSLGLMGLLSVATILSALNATANSATAHHKICGKDSGLAYGRSSYNRGYRPRYRHAYYGGHRHHHGYYLHYGSRGHKVAKLQHKLGVMGYFNHPRATGYFGRKTKHAVKVFQRDVGLRADGIVGPRTREALGI